MAEEDTKTDFRRGFLLASSLTALLGLGNGVGKKPSITYTTPARGMLCGCFVVVWVFSFFFFPKNSELGVESTGLA